MITTKEIKMLIVSMFPSPPTKREIEEIYHNVLTPLDDNREGWELAVEEAVEKWQEDQ